MGTRQQQPKLTVRLALLSPGPHALLSCSFRHSIFTDTLLPSYRTLLVAPPGSTTTRSSRDGGATFVAPRGAAGSIVSCRARSFHVMRVHVARPRRYS